MGSQINTNGAAPAVAPPTFSEAPASATVEAYDQGGRRWLLTTRASTTADLLTRLPLMQTWLDDHGWQSKPASKASQPEQPSEPAPTCDKCGQPMTRRQTKDGSRSFWSCQTRYGSEWCKGKPKA